VNISRLLSYNEITNSILLKKGFKYSVIFIFTLTVPTRFDFLPEAVLKIENQSILSIIKCKKKKGKPIHFLLCSDSKMFSFLFL